MRKIGITGGIGSGKSEASAYLELKGAFLIDADEISRNIAEKGEAGYEEIVKEFGEAVLFDGGELNRKKLADIVFSDQEKLETLNKIMHCKINDVICDKLEYCEKNGVLLVVLDVPLPKKTGFLELADEIYVVDTDMEIRIERLMKYRGFTYEEAMARINRQPSREEYLAIADVVLNNDGELSELFKQIDELL